MTVYLFENDWYHGVINSFCNQAERMSVSDDAYIAAKASLIGRAMIAQSIDNLRKDMVLEVQSIQGNVEAITTALEFLADTK